MHIYISHYQCLVTHWGGVECSRTHYSLPWQMKLRVEMHCSNGKEKQKSILKVAGCMTIWWVRWQKDKKSLTTCDPQMPISLMFIEVATNHIRYCGKMAKRTKAFKELEVKTAELNLAWISKTHLQMWGFLTLPRSDLSKSFVKRSEELSRF